MHVCVCLNFEDNDTKKVSKIMESSITERAREFMESSRKSKKKNERAGELLESSGSRGKKEEERMRELLESGSKEKEKGEDVLMDNGMRVWWTKCKRKRKEKETYG